MPDWFPLLSPVCPAIQLKHAIDSTALRVAEVETYVARRSAELPGGLEDLLELVGTETHPADTVAVNRAIIARAPEDAPAHNRLGRAYQELGLLEDARGAFDAVIRLDPLNGIARKRLVELRCKDLGR